MDATRCDFNYTGCRPMSNEEIDKIMASMTGRYATRDRLILLFGIKTGFRIAEILSVRVGDVWESGTVKDVVTVTKERMKGRKKSRSMPLHSDLRAAISDYLRAEKLDHDLHKRTALFHAQGRVTPLNPKQFWAILKRAARNSGVDSARIATHSARKTFSTRVWENPAIHGDILALAAVLGHANPRNSAAYVQDITGKLTAAVLAS